MFVLRLTLIIQVLRAIMVPKNPDILLHDYEFNGEVLLRSRRSSTYNEFKSGDDDACLLDFFRERFKSPQYVPVLIPLFSSFAERLLRRLLTTLPIYLLHGKLDSQQLSHRFSSNALLILEDFDSMKKVPSNLNHLCNSKCVVLLVLGKNFKNQQAFALEAESWGKALWEKKVANSAILYQVGGIFFLAKSEYFNANVPCTPSVPTSLGACKTGWSNWELYDHHIFLNNCAVSAAFFVEEPYVIGGSESNGVADGIEGDLLDIVSARLHVSMVGREVQWTNDSDYQNVLEQQLEVDDLVFGGLTWAPTEKIAYTLPYEVVPIIWLVPIIPRVSFRGLINPFSTHVWFAVVSVSILAIITRLLFLHELSLLQVFSLVLGNAWPQQPLKLSTRFQFLSWVIFGYILTQCYLASLAGQLIYDSNQQIETIEELVKSNFIYGGSPLLSQLISDHPQSQKIDSRSQSIETLMNRFIVFEFDEYREKLNDLLKGKNQSLALAVMLNTSSEEPGFNERKVNVMNEILGTFPLAFAVRGGLPYLDQLDTLIINIQETGLLRFLARRYTRGGKESSDDEQDSAFIGFKQLVPGFLLVVAGYALGFFVLAAEMTVVKYGNWRATKLKGKKKAVRRSKVE